MRALAEVHAAFAEFMELPTRADTTCDYDLIDVALATVVANRFEGDPLWLLLVGPPSTGKTEILRALGEQPDVYPLSSLTAQTFASGLEKRGTQTSLLPKLDGKTCVMKDFTTVLTMHRDKRAEIMAQLREIYDGSYSKTFGTGKEFTWAGKVGMLCACTQVIDREYSFNALLGERFLLCRTRPVDWRKVSARALREQATAGMHRRRIRDAVGQCLAACRLERPPIPELLAVPLSACATFVAMARSPVHFTQKGEMEMAFDAEGSGRLVKQLATLAQALAVVRGEGEVTPRTFETVQAIAWDCMPGPRARTLRQLRELEPLGGLEAMLPTTSAVAGTLGLPTSTTRNYLFELTSVGLVERRVAADGERNIDKWRSSATLEDLIAAMEAKADEPGADASEAPTEG